jgi:predicted TPR repeat methyltransferase
MKKISLNLHECQELHQAGLFEEARDGYLAILKKDPQQAETLHALGIVLAQLGDFNAAINYLKKALLYEPDNPVTYLNLGNALKSCNRLDEAIAAFLTAIRLKPNYSAAFNNLGTVYYAQNNFADAAIRYRQALALKPDYIDTSYNLGLALAKQKQSSEAIALYENIIKVAPAHAAAHFQLGCMLMAEGKLPQAESHFLLLEENYPHHFETQTNLGTCYLKLGALVQAKIHYKKALLLAPQDTQVLFNLGVIYMQLGETDKAIRYFQHAVQTDPDNFAAHNNLGVTFLSKQHPGYALAHFKEAQRLQPDNVAIRYTVQVLSQDQRLLASPSEYIKNLFDTYADHYEIHLQQALDYKVPAELLRAVKSAAKKLAPLDILDLGCGTGLCGVSFKPLAKTLTGVDLSPNMLAVAAEKKIYDELVDDEVVTYLSEKENTFDLILGGDVFVYLGDLNPLFSALKTALRSQGLVAFNTEITDKADYSMNQSGRFAHQKKYIDALATDYAFTVVFYEKIITRQQNNEPVEGHLYVLQKNA